MLLACLDLEGVLIPEVWIAVAEATGIDGLRRTTRDEPDYDALMRYRLDLLARNGLTLPEIQGVIGTLDPLPGAVEMVGWLRERFQLVILSDTFYEFGMPFMAKLGHPTLLCHKLIVEGDRIVDYALRLPDQKRAAVRAFHALNFRVIAAGDSYNDTAMLTEADAGVLFRPPANVIAEFPQFPVTTDYDGLRAQFERAAAVLG
ncbi:bifunctional phosphoserine phosphatase/homoserine phosphotransferase ThrH [Micropruina sonneratiae]|uniref:bifunctional phosphoserine phosphatase/homoserine phosphotransferase ThrH n=1 Tax=Micropruina sonneratiae TaxID=2986940 RepID=UPI00222647CB|nr:bifunctional phosphoserine phosphatase/homoserine phosphotransferase ThrH [Micropruina sp. KQZ13P-5]MCW3157522.1 bifunctional phosphoserine phosphatase/homoserine phosphotransferase ThrH [Micropruina sp. KQZ13P-5]